MPSARASSGRLRRERMRRRSKPDAVARLPLLARSEQISMMAGWQDDGALGQREVGANVLVKAEVQKYTLV